MEKTNIHAGHRKRLRERIHENGIYSLNDINYLEALLTFSIPRADTNPIAHNLLDEFKNLDSIFSADYAHLKRVKGVGEYTASLLSLVGASQFYRRKSKVNGHPIIDCLSKSINYILSVMPDSKK